MSPSIDIREFCLFVEQRHFNACYKCATELCKLFGCIFTA